MCGMLAGDGPLAQQSPVGRVRASRPSDLSSLVTNLAPLRRGFFVGPDGSVSAYPVERQPTPRSPGRTRHKIGKVRHEVRHQQDDGGSQDDSER
jgi:hypothetical protein